MLTGRRSPARVPRTLPRRARRGLGLVDSLLAVVVMTLVGIGLSSILTGWIDRTVSQAEARALSVWADAAATWVLNDFGGHNPGTTTPVEVSLDDVRGAVTLPEWADGKTPYRQRTIRLWRWQHAPDQVIVAAVASGGDDPVPLPAPGEGIATVGAIPMQTGATELRGAGFAHDLGEQLGAQPAMAGPGDMVALRHVARAEVDLYLHRRRVPGRLKLNRMEADLHMDGHDLTGAGSIGTGELLTDSITGPVTVEGDLDLNGALMNASGVIEAQGARITRSVEADRVTANSADFTEVNAETLRTDSFTCTPPCPGSGS